MRWYSAAFPNSGGKSKMSAYGPLAQVYDRFTNDVDYTAFADFYEKAFTERGPGAKMLLDLGCGTGSLTRLMAGRGYELIAVDASPDMLCAARDKCAGVPGMIPPLFLCQSMTELDLYGTVDAAYSSLDSVNYLPPEDIPELFRLLHLFIAPEGQFIFDINSPGRLRSLDGLTFVDEDEGALCLWRADFDEEENALIYGLDLFTRYGRFWRRSSEEHIEYAHEPDRLLELLSEAGFVETQVILDGPQSELGRIFIIAKNTAHEVC